MALTNVVVTDSPLKSMLSGWTVLQVSFTESVATGGTPVTTAAIPLGRTYKKLVPIAGSAQAATGMATAAAVLVDSAGSPTNTEANQVFNQIKARINSGTAESLNCVLTILAQVG